MDNYERWELHDREMQRLEENAERCSWCGNPLDETYYDLLGEHVCEECIDKCRRLA